MEEVMNNPCQSCRERVYVEAAAPVAHQIRRVKKKKKKKKKKVDEQNKLNVCRYFKKYQKKNKLLPLGENSTCVNWL